MFYGTVHRPMSKPLEKQKNCPICESDQLIPAFQVYYWQENLLHYSDCKSCGATFANPMPSNDLISLGNNALVRLYQQNSSPDQEFREARQAYLRGKLFAHKLTRWKKKGRLLELGCFNGFFLLGIRENSEWEVEGLEISSELCSFIKNTLGIHCYAGTLEEAQVPEERFDFIVCHDLIEHINQPQIFLNKLHAILTTRGRVQIITPNAKQDLAYTRRSFAAGIPMTMLLNHIMYFKAETLKLALQKTGLHPIQLHCYDIRYALKDFGWFGMGKPTVQNLAPSMKDTLLLKEKNSLLFWTPEKIKELRHHKKTAWIYGLIKETLPQKLTLRIPASMGIGHEIYALAEKRELR